MNTDNANLIVLSTDATLIDLLREAVDGRHRIWRVDDVERAAELVRAARLGVVLLDAALAADGTGELVAALTAALPTVPLLVAGRRDDENALAARISSGEVFRFVHKPVSPERARTFVDAAVRRRLELDPDSAKAPGIQAPAVPEPVQDATATTPAGPRPAPRPTATRPHRLWWPKRASDQEKLRRSLVPAIGFLVAGGIVVGVLVVQLWEDPTRASAALHAAEPVAPSPRATGVARLLDAAGIALSQGRLAEPPGRGALDLYRAVLDLDPQDARALQGLRRTADALMARAERALAARDLAVAEQAVAATHQADPRHPRLAFMDSQLEAERDRRRLEALAAAPTGSTAGATVTTPAPAVTPADRAIEASVSENLERARTAQRLGRFGGSIDSALAYLQSAIKVAPHDPRVVEATASLSEALLWNVGQAIDRSDFSTASALLGYADELGVDREAVGRARVRYESLRSTAIDAELARLLELANQRIAEGELLDPPGDSATHYVDLLRAANPSYRGLTDATAVLASRLMEESRRLAAAGRAQDAQRALDAAVGYGADPNAR